jgi:2-isopropylmalate synthase
MAVANSLAAVQAGARQVECAINGIGERAGNCALEEVVMALRTRAELFGIDTNIDTTRLVPISRLLSRVTKSPVVRNKAVVGRNAFAHEAGIHQHGVLEDARTYEVMRPQDVGLDQNELVLGKHSGRHAVGKRAREMGFEIDDNALSHAFTAFKRRADEIGALDDDELRAIFVNGKPIESGITLSRLEMRTEQSGKAAVAIAEMVRGGERVTRVGIGETALESAFLAVRQETCPMAEIEEIDLLQFGYGKDSDAEAETVIRLGDATFRGHGRGPDPLWAGARAFLHALNKAMQVPSSASRHQETRNEAAG